MALSFIVLGSGSAGNSTLIALERPGGATVHLLIDCGLSPRQTNKRLAPYGLSIEDVDHVILTHLDRDHFHVGWPKVLEQRGLPVHVHHRHRARALASQVPGRSIALFEDEVNLEMDDLAIEAVLFAHDALGTVGYIIDHAGARLGLATDLGRVPGEIYERFHNLHALALESNYDRAMQQASDRPWFLKQRIMGGSGHLSNDQALEAVVRIAEQSDLQHLALLHLSRQCNCPRRVTELYARQAPELLERLTVTSQTTPTPRLHVSPGKRRCANGVRKRSNGTAMPRPGEQMALF